MPALKPGTIWPTDEEDAAIQAGIDGFAHARPAREFFSPKVYAALTDKSKPATITLVSDEEDRARQKKMGRPPSANPKMITTIRLDADVMRAFKAIGRGWQTRINAVLREAVESGRV